MHLNQDFSGRAVKTKLHAIATLLQEKGNIHNGRSAAKEIGRLAVAELRKFDRVFRSTIPQNKCGCRIGAKPLTVDFNNLFDDLRSFRETQDVVHDCPVNEFLGLTVNGIAARLLEVEDVATKTKAGKQLANLRDRKKWVTCVECAKIGDAVIALEQSKMFCLVHIDHDFKILCSATDRPHKLVMSERAIERDAPR